MTTYTTKEQARREALEYKNAIRSDWSAIMHPVVAGYVVVTMDENGVRKGYRFFLSLRLEEVLQC